MAAIRLSKLRKQFGQVTAVRDISVTFEDGKMTSVLGPSGSGKSTTLNMIAGFITPDGGSISFGDRIIADPARHIMVPSHKRELGMVFQSYALWPHLSVADNVGYGLKMRGIRRAERERIVRSSLSRVRLEGFLDRYPHELSGGEQQRVALARAIAYAPQILLFDEPLSNLDAKLRDQMRGELKTLHAEIGVTAIYVTHDQSEAMSLSEKIVVMGDGEILQIGTPKELYETPADVRVATFIGRTNLLDATVVESTPPYGRVRVDGVAGTILCRSCDAATGAMGSLSIRPESVRLRPVSAGPGAIDGVVLSGTYLGDMLRYQIALGETLRLEAQQSAADLFSPGQAVAIEIDPDRCCFFIGRKTIQ